MTDNKEEKRLRNEQPLTEQKRIKMHWPDNDVYGKLHRAILQVLTAGSSMKGVDALTVTNPCETNPYGCLVRMVTYLSYPGNDVCHIEIRYDEELGYHIWFCRTTTDTRVFTRKEYNIDQTLYLLFRILAKWEKMYPREDSLKLASDHFFKFKKITKINKACPEDWYFFELLLHHVILDCGEHEPAGQWDVDVRPSQFEVSGPYGVCSFGWLWRRLIWKYYQYGCKSRIECLEFNAEHP
jgi:hypothetical protein